MLTKHPSTEFEPTLEEMESLLEHIFQATSYDFRRYSSQMIRRRIIRRMRINQHRHISSLLTDILTNRTSMNNLISDFCIHVTEMFRNPALFLLFRKKFRFISRGFLELSGLVLKFSLRRFSLNRF